MIRIEDILEKISVSYHEKDVNILRKAYVFAGRAHKGQIRRSGEPYLSHSLEVANMLADMKLDKTTLVAGLLHDVLEDTEVSAEELRENFGKEVADLVEGVTKISRVQETSPEVRRAETIQKIILAMTDDLRVIFIKLSDRIHNLKTLKYLAEDKQRRIAKETLEIYAPIANRLGMGRIKAELEDLSFRYVEPEAYFRIEALIEPQKKKAEDDLEKLKAELDRLMKENKIPARVEARIKRTYSIFDKMKRREIDFDQVYDFLALRIITDTAKNCYAALGIIHQRWTHLPNRLRDFIAVPKPNLYQALHTTILTGEKRTYEIQIRTLEMHNLAENGIAAHWKYKEPDSSHMIKEDQRLAWLREVVELYEEQKNPREFLKNLKTNLIPEEVYVFTPKGRVISLPLGASALDFAFQIHSEIGLHAAGVKINGRAAPLRTILKIGDIVEVQSSPEKTPRRDWLNIVFTSTARHQIKRWLNQRERVKSFSLGKKLWNQILAKYSLPTGLDTEARLIERLSQVLNYRVRKIEDFYTLAGSGKIIIDGKFMERLSPEGRAEERKPAFLERVIGRVRGKSGSGILVKGGEAELVKLARCCSPVKGEPITGYMTAGKGITVHAVRCPLVVKEILASERLVEVQWDPSAKGVYKARLLVRSVDSPGVLANVAVAIAQSEGNITKAEVSTFPDQKAQIVLSLIIRDIGHLESIMGHITKFKEISSVERI